MVNIFVICNKITFKRYYKEWCKHTENTVKILTQYQQRYDNKNRVNNKPSEYHCSVLSS